MVNHADLRREDVASRSRIRIRCYITSAQSHTKVARRGHVRAFYRLRWYSTEDEKMVSFMIVLPAIYDAPCKPPSLFVASSP